jgi:Family of unknown function (DUF6155)
MTPPKITLNQLKQYLKTISQEESNTDITELFKRFPAVKEYYQIKLYPQAEAEVLAKYKKTIEDEFFPARGFGKARLSIAKKAISDYKKVCNNEVDIIDIMLFYVEQGVKFTLAYGDIDEAFYASMEGMYDKALNAMTGLDSKNVFEQRSQKIVTDTSDIGWGFHDTLSEIYETVF